MKRRATYLQLLLILGVSYSLCCSNSIHGQTNSSETKKDAQVDSITRVIRNICVNYPDSALVLIDIASSRKFNASACQKVSLHLLDLFVYQMQANKNEASKALEKVEALLGSCNERGRHRSYYNELAKFYAHTKPTDSVKQYIRKVIEYDLEARDSSRLISSYLYMGNTSFANADSALHYYGLAKEIAINRRDSSDIALAIASIANTYLRTLGDYNLALKNFEECLPIFEKTNKYAEVTTYRNIAIIHRDQERYDLAIQTASIALEKAKEYKIPREINHSYASIATVYQKMGRIEDAIETTHKNISYSKSMSLMNSVYIGYGNLGDLYAASNIDSAKYYLHKAINDQKLTQDLATKQSIANSKYSLALILEKEGDMEKAEELYQESFKLHAPINSSDKNMVALGLIQFYLKLFESPNETDSRPIDFEQVEQLLKEIERYSFDNNLHAHKEMLLKTKVALFKFKGEKDSLYKYQEKIIVLKDSLYENSKLEFANEWAEKLKTKEKELEIEKLSVQNELTSYRNKMYLFALIGTVFFFGLISFLGIKYLRQRNEKQKMQEAQQFRSKLSADLHDEVGTILSTLSMKSQLVSMSVDEEHNQEVNSIIQLSKEAMGNMRDTVWAIDSRKDKYENLIDRMQEYAVENLRLKNIAFKLNKNDFNGNLAIDPVKRQNLFLIFKEAITNILKHSNADRVTLYINQSSDQFDLRLHDNGEASNKTISDGLGLSNMKMRAEEIGANLKVDQSAGYETRLTMKL